MSAPVALTTAEKVEAHTALADREKAINETIAHIDGMKNHGAHATLKTKLLQSLVHVASAKSKVRP